MSPIQQMLLGVGASADKIYVDDVFSTNVYTGNSSSTPSGTTQAINTGFDLASEGGLIWNKGRNFNDNHFLIDTVRGNSEVLRANTSGAETDLASIYLYATPSSTGYTVGSNYAINGADQRFVSWAFRKAPGFFDIVTYTGNGAGGGRNINHSLSSIPGCVIVKCTSESQDWAVYHRGVGTSGKYLSLNDTDAATTDFNVWNNNPTSTYFSIGSSDKVNKNNATYVAYVFAGGEDQTTATAKSVDFDGSGDYLRLASNSDLCPGTSDFTFEAWIHPDAAWSTSIFQGIYVNGYDSGVNGALWIGNNPNSGGSFVVRGGGVTDYISASYPPVGQWTHIAVTRSGSTLRLFYNGILEKSVSNSINFPTTLTSIGSDGSGSDFNGAISNLRFVKGTAVYTSSFRPPTEPLTNITNTKLLCCNNSSTTGSTVTPGTITANGNPTASTDSPFDDPAGFKFGESGSGNVIKCGSHSNSATQNVRIYTGWEPRWVMTKNVSASSNWGLFDCIRGMFVEEDSPSLVADTNNSENGVLGANKFIFPHADGFTMKYGGTAVNPGNGNTIIYIAIRSATGTMTRPPELGTDVFAMDTGSSSFTPTFDSGFPVDFALLKRPAANSSFLAQSRITGDNYLLTNAANVEVSHPAFISWDSNVGWAKSWDSNRFSWMFKRYAGFDLVAYKGNAVSGTQISHSLNAVPQMIWIKRRDSAKDWTVGHYGVNAGTNPWNYYLELNGNQPEANQVGIWNNTAPTSSHFTLGNWTQVNQDDGDGAYLAMLFTSVSGISSVGSFVGNSSGSVSVTTGFQPRFILIKNSEAYEGWILHDSVRGMSNNNDQRLFLNTTAAQTNEGGYEFISVSSTGFTVTNNGGSVLNGNNQHMLYYAHA